MRKTTTISKKYFFKPGKRLSLSKANDSQSPYLACLGSKLSYTDLKEFDWKSNLPVLTEKLPNTTYLHQDFNVDSFHTEPVIEHSSNHSKNGNKLVGSYRGLKALKHSKETTPFLHIITLSSKVDSTPNQPKDHFWPKKRGASINVKNQSTFGSFALPKRENPNQSTYPNRHGSFQENSHDLNDSHPIKLTPKSPLVERRIHNPQSKPLNPNDFRRLTRKRPILRDLTSPEKPLKGSPNPVNFRFQSISTSYHATNELLNDSLEELPKNKIEVEKHLVSKSYLTPNGISFNEKPRSNSSTSNIYELGDSDEFTIENKPSKLPSKTQADQEELFQDKNERVMSLEPKEKSIQNTISKLGRIVGSNHERRKNAPKIILHGARSKKLSKAPKLEL